MSCRPWSSTMMRIARQEVVQALLRPHHADVADAVRPAASHAPTILEALEAAQVRRTAHDDDVLTPLASPRKGDTPVRVVGGDDDIRRRVRQALRQPDDPVSPAAPSELGLEEFGHDVVLIVDDARAVDRLVPARDEKEEVRRIADVDHRKALALARRVGEPRLAPEGGAVLPHVAARAAALGREVVPIDAYTFEDLELGLESPPGRTDHGDRPAGALQGRRLHPDPAVEGDRQVLDDEEDATRRCRGTHGPRVVRLGVLPGRRRCGRRTRPRATSATPSPAWATTITSPQRIRSSTSSTRRPSKCGRFSRI